MNGGITVQLESQGDTLSNIGGSCYILRSTNGSHDIRVLIVRCFQLHGEKWGIQNSLAPVQMVFFG